MRTVPRPTVSSSSLRMMLVSVCARTLSKRWSCRPCSAHRHSAGDGFWFVHGRQAQLRQKSALGAGARGSGVPPFRESGEARVSPPRGREPSASPAAARRPPRPRSALQQQSKGRLTRVQSCLVSAGSGRLTRHTRAAQCIGEKTFACLTLPRLTSARDRGCADKTHARHTGPLAPSRPRNFVARLRCRYEARATTPYAPC